jgi:RecA/RadA recombinase
MKSTEVTRKVSYGILGLFTIYGIFAIPFAFFLLAVAVGLIVYGVSESLEITTAATLITGVLAVLINKYNRKEGFMTGGNAKEIVHRIESVKRPQEKAPVGVYASGYVEAFEDLSDNVVPAATEATAPTTTKTTSAESQAAPATATAPKEKAGFKNAAEPGTDGLFKLGVLPSEDKGGFHIDQGTTVLNALNALQPDQVKRMSEDTQKLIDTQKSLMSMLGTMKPMLADGKQLVETFNQMFGTK